MQPGIARQSVIGALLQLLQIQSVPSTFSGDGTMGSLATEDARCTQVGSEIIQAGGNAVDASVATSFCLGVVVSYHSGIGGGGFALVRSPEGEYETVDFRDQAPAAAHEDMFANASDPAGRFLGGLSVAVPGEVRGLAYLHENYGSLPWADLVAPAIQIARDGFEISIDMFAYLYVTDHAPHYPLGTSFMAADPAWAIDFAPAGKRLWPGSMIKRERLADALETIAKEGADAFYTGRIAEATVSAVQAAGGVMTLEDLAKYEVISRPALNMTYRGHKVTSCSAPAGGPAMLGALSIMSEFDVSENANETEALLSSHRVAESLRFAFAQFTKIADPAFLADVSERETIMLSKSNAAKIRAQISDEKTFHDISHYFPEGETPIATIETAGTAHISVADKSGLAVSLTTSIDQYWGSRIMVPETGVIMNDAMFDFAVPGQGVEDTMVIPQKTNFPAPGKRPLSGMAPTIIETPAGELHSVIGGTGGNYIVSAVVQSIRNMLELKMTVAEALAQRRIHSQLIPDEVLLEKDNFMEFVPFITEEPSKNWTWTTKEYLEDRGHKVEVQDTNGFAISGVNALQLLPNGTFAAAAEPRLGNSGAAVV